MMIDEILEKINERIIIAEKGIAYTKERCKLFDMKCNVSRQFTTLRTLNWVKAIIQAEQKPKTNGDAIRESNKSLAKTIIGDSCQICAYKYDSDACSNNYCEDGVLNYFNQPIENEVPNE